MSHLYSFDLAFSAIGGDWEVALGHGETGSGTWFVGIGPDTSLAWSMGISHQTPQHAGIKAALNKDDARRYETGKLGALGRLIFINTQCKDFLMSHGVNIESLIDAVMAQRPYDGKSSTITRVEAGVVDPNNPVSVSVGQLPISRSFKNDTGTNAETAIWPGGTLGATMLDRSDVYFRRAGLSTVAILHEALHSLLGETDVQLQTRFKLSTKGLSSNISDALRNADCAE